MTILLSTIIVTTVAIIGAKAFKAHLDRHYPSVEDDEELEALLAHGLAVEFSRGQK